MNHTIGQTRRQRMSKWEYLFMGFNTQTMMIDQKENETWGKKVHESLINLSLDIPINIVDYVCASISFDL